MTLRTIQPIGKNPVTAPRTVARSDISAGIVKITMATKFATMSAITAAMCALTLFDAIRTRRVTTGSAAAAVDRNVLFSGLYIWFHILGPLDLAGFVIDARKLAASAAASSSQARILIFCCV